MHGAYRIEQFVSDPGRRAPRWAYGWGFEAEGLVFVLFGSVEGDNEFVKLGHTMHTHTTRKPEHGPAHVHVIDKQTGRERKFMLHETQDGEAATLMPKGWRESLTDKQVMVAQRILAPHAGGFLQCWREQYMHDSDMLTVRRDETDPARPVGRVTAASDASQRAVSPYFTASARN